MTSPHITLDPYDDPATFSLRSRASSIVTTTTKFSLETLSQDDGSSFVAFRERQRPDPAERPRSLLSMTSIARPAPPYSAILDSTLLLPTHQHGDFVPTSDPPAETPTPPIPVPQLANEATAPSFAPSSPPSASALTPPNTSPDIDEDPRAQISYYSHVVRTLDQNYTTELDRLRSQHAQELAAIRNEIDAAYRAQWKAKNREIERIREQAAEEIELVHEQRRAEVIRLEGELSMQRERMDKELKVKIEKARHKVEDIWEKRWSDRGKVEGEEKERTERERRKELADRDAEIKNKWKRRLDERDERWREAMEEVVRVVNPELCDMVLDGIKARDDLMEMGFT
ncbi:MAG: hypothetical protein Q9170_002107 [Blastenia crenularia]